MDDDLITDLDVRLAGLELLVTKVKGTVNVELAITLAILGNKERGVAKGTTFGEGSIIGNPAYLALHIDIFGCLVVFVGSPFQVGDGSRGSSGIVWILESSGTLRLGFGSLTSSCLAIQGIQICARGSLGSVTLVIH